MKQIMVLKLDIHDIKIKQKAMQAVSGISGVDSVSVDSKGNKMTVKGDVDPVEVVAKLRKFCPTDLVSVGPEPQKKKEPKKETQKKKKEPKKPAAVDKKPEDSQQGCIIC